VQLNAYYMYNKTQLEHKKVRKYNLPVRLMDAIDTCTLKRYKRLKRDAIEWRTGFYQKRLVSLPHYSWYKLRGPVKVIGNWNTCQWYENNLRNNQ